MEGELVRTFTEEQSVRLRQACTNLTIAIAMVTECLSEIEAAMPEGLSDALLSVMEHLETLEARLQFSQPPRVMVVEPDLPILEPTGAEEPFRPGDEGKGARRAPFLRLVHDDGARKPQTNGSRTVMSAHRNNEGPWQSWAAADPCLESRDDLVEMTPKEVERRLPLLRCVEELPHGERAIALRLKRLEAMENLQRSQKSALLAMVASGQAISRSIEMLRRTGHQLHQSSIPFDRDETRGPSRDDR